MLKSIILGSILLATQVLCGDYQGSPCLDGQCTTNQRTCDSVNPTKLLKCGSNSIYCGVPAGSTFWKIDQVCGYCCNTLKSNGPYCVNDKAACDKDRSEQFN
jgi:hypothetical protein